jgi:hypothetical protein
MRLTFAAVLALASLTSCTTEQQAQHTGVPTERATTSTTTTAPTTTTTQPVVPATTAPPVTTTLAEVVPLESSEPVPQSGGSVEAAIARAFSRFGSAVVGEAIRVATCESELHPGAVSSTNDHGVFQLHAGSSGFPGGWVETFEDVTGAPFYDGVYDPDLNSLFAAWLYDRSGWQPWACRSAA